MPAQAQRLRQLARRASAEREARQEQCELCGEPLPPTHRHLLDLESRELMCACRACTVLFDRREAGGSHFRLVPDLTKTGGLGLVLVDRLSRAWGTRRTGKGSLVWFELALA